MYKEKIPFAFNKVIKTKQNRKKLFKKVFLFNIVIIINIILCMYENV